MSSSLLGKEAVSPASLQVSSEAAPQFRQHMGRISRHSTIFFAGTIFTAAAGYSFKIYLARYLGAEALGIYALGMTIVGFLSLFGALGIPQSVVRFVATYMATGRMDQLRGFILWGALFLLFLNAVLGGALLFAGRWISVRFYHTPALRQYLPLFALVMFFGAFTGFLGWVVVGYKQVARRTVITDFIGTPLMMILTLALVAAGFGLWGYIFAQVVSAIAVLALLLIVVWKLTPKEARAVSGSWAPPEREVVWFAAVLFGMSVLAFFASQADKIFIGFYLNPRQVGIYSVAAALVAFVPAILQSVNQIFSPTIADLHTRGDHDLLARIYRTLTKWTLGLTVPLAAAMIVFSRPLMRVFGPDFEPGWPILIIGTLGQLVNCGVGSVGYLLLMSGHERRMMRIQAVTAALMVGLNVLLIPRWGIVGAALAAAITNVLTNAWYLLDVRKTLGLLPFTRSYLRLALPVAATLLVLAVARAAFRPGRLELPVMAAGLALAYATFISTALLRGLDADDRLVTDAIWARLRGRFQRAEADA